MDKLDCIWEDAVVVGPSDVLEYNEDNILPQPDDINVQIRAWLQPTDYESEGSEYRRHLTSHLPGTGKWFLESDIYQQWHDGDEHGLLWVRGIPGSGKSVLAATVIRDLFHEHAPVLYFFSRQIIDVNSTTRAALQDWLTQVLVYSPPLQYQLKDYLSDSNRSEMPQISSHSRPLDSLDPGDLWLHLRTALLHLPKVYILVDALDEMEQGEDTDNFLRNLSDLARWRPSQVKVMITSRPVTNVERALRLERTLHLRLDEGLIDADISAYVRARLTVSSIPLELHEHIQAVVPVRARGLFLYAKLALDALFEQNVELRMAVQDLPKNLHAIYSGLLHEHMQKTGVSIDIQLLIMQWMTHSIRPLRLIEMADMLSNETSFRCKDLSVAKTCIRSACGSLLELLPDETLSIVHHSLTEFLKGTARTDAKDYPVLDFASTHKQLALTCLSYLQNGCLEALESELLAPRTPLAAKESHGAVLAPFTKYAALNWHVHAKRAIAHGADQSDLIIGLNNFTSHANFQKWVRIAEIRSDSSRPITPLSMAVMLGLLDYVRTLLSQGNVDCDEGAPLVWAANKGLVDVVELLIQHGADVNKYDGQGYTALHRAAINDRASVVRLLLQAGCDMESRTQIPRKWYSRGLPDYQRTALWYACDYDHRETVKEFQAQMKTSKEIQTALLYALKKKKAYIVRELLEHPLADVNRPIEDSDEFCGRKKTLLGIACSHRDLGTIEVLLAAGADATQYQLHFLAGSNEATDSETSIRCFNLLLEAGADVHQCDPESYLNTPLHMAEDVIATSILLEAGADVEAENERDETPLHTCTNIAVRHMLVTIGNANLEKQNSNGQTPLLASLRNDLGSKENAESRLALIDLGANVDAVDKQGNGVFHYVVRKSLFGGSQEMVISRLCQAGGDINRINSRGEAPIHLTEIEISPVVHSMDFQIPKGLFEILVAAGANLTPTMAGSSRTSLFTWIANSIFRSSESNLPDVSKVISRCGASLHITDDRGRTLLHDATTRSRLKPMIPFLIDQGVNLNAVDNEGNTFWHEDPTILASSIFEKADKLLSHLDRLTQLGIDPTCPNHRGRTPLHVLSSVEPKLVNYDTRTFSCRTGFGHRDEITAYEVVSSFYPNVDVVDKDGVTPLHIAATYSEYIVRVLLRKNANPSCVTNEGCNALHLSARAKMPNIVSMLLDNLRSRSAISLQLAINAKDHLGRVPLYYAYNAGSFETARALVDAGAKIETESYEISPWKALADHEADIQNWTSRSNDGYTGAVLIADKRRPHVQYGYNEHIRIDELIMLLSAGRLSPLSFLDRAIADATSQQADFIVECLLQARKSMPTEEKLDYTDQIASVISRRQKKRMELETPCRNCNINHNPSPFRRAALMQEYYLLPKILLREMTYQSSLKMEAMEISSLQDLIKNGFASVLKDLIALGGPKILDNQAWSILQSDSQEEIFGSSKRTSFEPLLLRACRRDVSNMDVITVLVEQARHDINTQQVPREPIPPFNMDSPYQKKPDGEGVLHTLVRGERWWHINEALPYFLKLGPDLELKDSHGMTPLNAALHDCGKPVFNKRAVEFLVQHGADVNAADIAGNSCLAKACSDMEMVNFLLDHKAIVTRDVLIQAIELDRPDLIELFLDKGADPNARWRMDIEMPPERFGRKGRTWISSYEDYPLHRLLSKVGRRHKNDSDHPNVWRMIKLLLEHGADPCASYERTTILHELVKHDADINPMFAFDSASFNLESRDASGRTALLLACLRNSSPDSTGMNNPENRSTIGLLIHHGADVRAEDLQGNNALHIIASENGRFIKPSDYGYIVQQAPELINRCNNEMHTPLHISMRCANFSETATVFLENGGDVHAVDRDGNTMLHLLATGVWWIGSAGELPRKIFGLFKRLLTAGLDINATNGAGETPIYTFFREGQVKHRNWKAQLPYFVEKSIYDLFTQHGVNWHALNTKGQSLLHVVVNKPSISSSFYSSPSNADDETSYSCKRFEALLKLGLDPRLEDKDGRTPLDIAADVDQTKILELFL